MEGFVNKILDVLLALVIFFALIGVIITSTNGISWGALNIGGTVTNLAWAPYVIVLVIVVGAVYLVYKYMITHKK